MSILLQYSSVSKSLHWHLYNFNTEVWIFSQSYANIIHFLIFFMTCTALVTVLLE